MKRTLITLFGVLIAMASLTFDAKAQPAVLIFDNIDLGDSAIVNLGEDKGVFKWDSLYVEALFTALTADDTTAQVEIYNTLNYNFTDAANLAGTDLVAADGAGGTGTIMKTSTITGANFSNLRFVCDPDVDDSGAGKLTLRIIPYYKQNYSPPQ